MSAPSTASHVTPRRPSHLGSSPDSPISPLRLPNFWDPTSVKTVYDNSSWSTWDRVKVVAAGTGFAFTKLFADMEGREIVIRSVYNLYEVLKEFSPALFPGKGVKLMTSFGAVDELIIFMWGFNMFPYFFAKPKEQKVTHEEHAKLSDTEKKSWVELPGLTSEQIKALPKKDHEALSQKIKDHRFKVAQDGVKTRVLKDGSIYFDRSRVGITKFQFDCKYKPWKAVGMVGFAFCTFRSAVNFLFSFGLVKVPSVIGENKTFAKLMNGPIGKAWEWSGPLACAGSYGAFAVGNGYRILTSREDLTRSLPHEFAKLVTNVALTTFHVVRFFGLRSPAVQKSAAVIGCVAGTIGIFSFTYQKFRKEYKEKLNDFNRKSQLTTVEQTPRSTPKTGY